MDERHDDLEDWLSGRVDPHAQLSARREHWPVILSVA